MDNVNMVTISVDEHFELRQKAAMNEFLLKEFGVIEARLVKLENSCDILEWSINDLKRSVK